MNLKQISEHISFPEILDDFIGGSFIINMEGKVIFWSKGATEITGFSKDDAVGQHCSFLESSTCDTFKCREGSMNCGLYKKGRIRDIHCTCRSKDGKIKHIVRNGVVIRDAQGKAVGGLESIVDITQLYSAELAIEELRKTVEGRAGYGKIVGKSRSMQDIYDLIGEVSDSTATVLICGESGTGKELIADAIHFKSPRADKPFVKVNCAALTETLLESELFGHARGSFTGAVADKQGRFEIADGGTIFLDEIGEISPLVQVKLLRVLQERSFERVGSNRTVKIDVRVITATNRDLAKAVHEGRFREDLYYRLNVIPIKVPPLRERPEDIPLLVNAFIDKFNKSTGKNIERVDEDAMSLLLDYNWPGNIRELENAIEHAFVRSKERQINIYSLPQQLRVFHFGGRTPVALNETNSKVNIVAQSTVPYAGRVKLTREIIEVGLKETKYNRGELAKRLGVSRTTLWKKMDELLDGG